MSIFYLSHFLPSKVSRLISKTNQWSLPWIRQITSRVWCLLFGSHVACGLWPVRTWSDRWFVKWPSKRMNSRHDTGETNVKFKKGTDGLILIQSKSHFVHLFDSICLSLEDCTVLVIFHCYHGNSLLQFWFAAQCDPNVPQQLLLVLSFLAGRSCCHVRGFSNWRWDSICSTCMERKSDCWDVSRLKISAEKEKQWDSITFDSEVCLVMHNIRQNYRDILAFPLVSQENNCGPTGAGEMGSHRGETWNFFGQLFWPFLWWKSLRLVAMLAKAATKGAVVSSIQLQIVWRNEWECANISVILCVCGGQRRKVLVYVGIS